ncbi:MAG: ATPase [Chitinophagia bacterium]|nr:ATPase [Chitinophagia bacterium]
MSKKKVMYSVEYPIRCSPAILYEFLSTPVGLQEWFADKVDQRDHKFFFTWNGATESAEILEHIENEFIRYRWDYYPNDEFFEFSIEQSPVTSETILRITDFADKSDIKDQEQLWNSQISDLKHRIGAA